MEPSPFAASSARKNHLGELLDSSPDAMVILNREGLIWRANPEMCRMFSYELAEFLGHSIELVMPIRFRRAFQRRLKRYFKNPIRQKMGQGLEVAGLHRNQSEFPIAISISPLNIDDEIMAVCAVRDLTDRYQQELILREREARFRNLMEAAPDGIILSDSTGKILQLNPQICNIFKYDAKEMLGMNVRDLMPEKYRPIQDALLRRFLRDPKRIEMGRNHHLNGLCKNGEVFPLELNVSPIIEENETLVVSCLRDITERRDRENQLKIAQQAAESANQAKSEFLSHMSHELRTPLNGILGYTQILKQDTTLTAEQQSGLESIMNCGEHLLSLINDVLDLSKIEAGHEELNLAPTDLHLLINEVTDILRPRTRDKGLKFTVKIKPEVPIGVITDAAKVRQILVNLLSNAIKFTSEGEVTLSVKQKKDGLYQFRVCDTGIGMNSDELNIIFDPFRQVEAGKAAGGTGLGLSICKHLSEMLGGSLLARSTKDQGSRFDLRIPLKDHSLTEHEAMTQEQRTNCHLRLAPGQEATILVADDRQTNLDILDQLLRLIGFNTLTADDGDTAIKILKTTPVDLVLMDVRMPRMNGIDAVQKIRSNDSLSHLKVVAATASVFPDFKQKALDAGFDDFLSKPFRAAELYQILQTHLDLEFVNQEMPGEKRALTAPQALPPAIAKELASALEIRNFSKINQLIEQLTHAPETEAIAHELKKHASKFDFEALQKFT